MKAHFNDSENDRIGADAELLIDFDESLSTSDYENVSNISNFYLFYFFESFNFTRADFMSCGSDPSVLKSRFVGVLQSEIIGDIVDLKSMIPRSKILFLDNLQCHRD